MVLPFHASDVTSCSNAFNATGTGPMGRGLDYLDNSSKYVVEMKGQESNTATFDDDVEIDERVVGEGDEVTVIEVTPRAIKYSWNNEGHVSNNAKHTY